MANFVQVVNGEVVGRYDLLPVNWNGHNLKQLTKEQLKEHGWYHVVVEEQLGWDGNTHRMTGPQFTIREDDVLEKYILVALTPEEIAENEAARAQTEAELTENIVLSISQEKIDANEEIAELVNKLKTLTSD